jgi:predicted ArsR family transcriptional regulator
VRYSGIAGGHLRDEVRELERERVTVQEAARRLGITESAVRKRAVRGQIHSDKVTEGNRERLYIYLDKDQDQFPEPFRERYMRSLEDRVRTLEDEVYRQQAIILSMSQSLQALTGASEAPQVTPEAAEGSEPQPTAEEPQEPTERRSWWRRVFGG